MQNENSKLKNILHQFAKYFITGISGVILDMVTLILFKEIFGWLPVVAVIVNQILLLGYIFLINKYWTFKNKEIPHKQIIRFLILAGFNYLFSVFVMYIFNHKFGFDYRLVRLASIASMVSWNFFLYKYWIYAELSQKSYSHPGGQYPS